jgi:hypothetical protein
MRSISLCSPTKNPATMTGESVLPASATAVRRQKEVSL